MQEARLVVLKDLLRQRDEAQKEVTSERLNQIYSKHQKDKETKLHKIHNDYLRCKKTAASALIIRYIDINVLFKDLLHSFSFISSF